MSSLSLSFTLSSSSSAVRPSLSRLPMAAEVLSWTPIVPSLSRSKAVKDVSQQQPQPQPWLSRRSSAKKRCAVSSIHASLTESLIASPPRLVLLDQLHQQTPSTSLFLLAADTAGYSLASYYTSLGLFVISVPGLWSLIKRSVKSKIVQKTFIGEEKKAPNQLAGEILSFTRNNFVVTDRGETITFEGMMVPSRGQAALLTFCTCISLASGALVLTSPLAGAYYWKRASRKEQIKVKMIVIDDGAQSEVVVQGDDQQVEQMRKELKLSEKGVVYVKGLFER